MGKFQSRKLQDLDGKKPKALDLLTILINIKL